MVAKSESIKELSAALARAQSQIKGASKDSANPYFKSRYADLASVWDACRDALTKHGLAVTQWPSAEGPRVTVETILTHESGEWISRELTITAKEDSPQAIGSAVTYARRYALAAVAGVAPEDDDGEAAEGRRESPKKQSEGEPVRLTKGQKDTQAALDKLIQSAKDDEQVTAAAKCCMDDFKAGKITAGQLDLLKTNGQIKRQSLQAMDEMNAKFAESVG